MSDEQVIAKRFVAVGVLSKWDIERPKDDGHTTLKIELAIDRNTDVSIQGLINMLNEEVLVKLVSTDI